MYHGWREIRVAHLLDEAAASDTESPKVVAQRAGRAGAN
jgi:hypothetical protein